MAALLLTLAGAPASAVLQVETATVGGAATASANVIVTVTAAGMTGSPKAINVAVVNGDSAAVVAGKIRTTLAADVDVTALFAVGGSSTAVTLTRLTSAANDATLNVAIDGTTNTTGVPDAASSANTTAGVYGTYRGAPPGTRCADTTNGRLYENSGTLALPVWSAL